MYVYIYIYIYICIYIYIYIYIHVNKILPRVAAYACTCPHMHSSRDSFYIVVRIRVKIALLFYSWIHKESLNIYLGTLTAETPCESVCWRAATLLVAAIGALVQS